MNEIPGSPEPDKRGPDNSGPARSIPDASGSGSPGSGQTPGELDELKAWLSWLQQAAVAGGTLSRLAVLELRLALSDSKRLLILGLAMVPLIVLAWIGFAVLLAWLAYEQSQLVSLGLLTFVVVQLLALAILFKACKVYRRSLSLPATRSHLQAFVEGTQRGTPTTDR